MSNHDCSHITLALLFRHIFIHFSILFFFFNATSTTEIYTLSLHDALPIFWSLMPPMPGTKGEEQPIAVVPLRGAAEYLDRKSTRLNSSHVAISYAVFCLKKKKKKKKNTTN